jgi:Lon protease-like protein
MISRCLKSETPFGVLLIKDGEAAGPATTYEVGTLATIADFYQGSDGLLGITALGGQRFRLVSSERQHDGLNIGEVELIEAEANLPLPEKFRALPDMLSNVLDDLGRLYDEHDCRYEDAVWVTYRFLEILPISLEQKQLSLESNDTLARLKLVDKLLDSVRGPAHR